MASKIVWRPRASLRSNGIVSKGRRLAGRLPAAALLLLAAAIAAHSGYTQLVGSSKPPTAPLVGSSKPPTAPLVGSSKPPTAPLGTSNSTPQAATVAASQFSQPLPKEGFHAIGDPSGVLPLPAAAADFDGQATGTEAPSATTRQANAAFSNKPAAKPRAVRKKPTLSNNAPPVAASTNAFPIFAWFGGNRTYGQSGFGASNSATDRRRIGGPRSFN
jgi:hypothetical protein